MTDQAPLYELRLHYDNALHVFKTCGCAADISERVHSIMRRHFAPMGAADRAAAFLNRTDRPCVSGCMPPTGREVAGVYFWSIANHYPKSEALMTYADRTTAQRWADDQNAVDGGNRVVRVIVDHQTSNT